MSTINTQSGRPFKHSAIATYENIDNKRNIDVSAVLLREKFFAISEIARDDTCTAVIPVGMSKKCVKCLESLDENDVKTVKCEERGCNYRFHTSCMVKYNRDSFNFAYSALPECQNALLCPLHRCAACDEDGLKQTAHNEKQSKLIECAVCFRSFHLEKCVPVGSRFISVHVKKQEDPIPMIVCPAHCPSDETIQMSHIKVCQLAECTRPESDLLACSSCPAKFHIECQTVVGEAIREQCERCVRGLVIRENVPVLASYQGDKTDAELYLAITRNWSCHSNQNRVNQMTETLGKLGYVVLEWINLGKDTKKQFSIMHISKMMPLQKHHIRVAAKRWQKRWENVLNEFATTMLYNPCYNFVRKYANKVLVGDDLKSELIEHKIEMPLRCSCDDDCKSADCDFFDNNSECTEKCRLKDNKPCSNRNATMMRVNEKIEVRESGQKGLGVFARQAIARGEHIAVYAGEVITVEESTRRTNVIKAAGDKEGAFYHAYCGKVVIDAGRFGNESRYINHSCDPNCEFSVRYAAPEVIMNGNGSHKIAFQKRLCLNTVKDIEEGTELTFSYNMNFHSALAKCECGARNCTGKMGKEVNNNGSEKSSKGKSSKKSSKRKRVDKENQPSTSAVTKKSRKD